MDGAELCITYNGPALETHQMDVRDLAPALIALTDAIQQAQSILHPNDPPVRVNVKATREGSFAVILNLASDPNFLERTLELITGREATAIINLKELSGMLIAACLFAVASRKKKIRNKRDEGEYSTVTFDDGSTLTIPAKSLHLYQDSIFRNHMRDTVRPLETDGIDGMAINTDTKHAEIQKDEAAAFDVPELPDELLIERSTEEYLRLLTPDFENRKWRLSDGTTSFWAKIDDQVFKDRVEAKELSFGSGDMLRAILHTEQYRTDKGLRTNYTVTEVIEHIDGGRQLPLDFETDDN